jgi:hypothetical protein
VSAVAAWRVIATLAAGLTAAACDPISWTRVTLNHPLKAEDVTFIVPGKTTLKDVVARLGAPDQLIGIHDGMAANYLYEDSKYFRVNFGWPLGVIDPLSYAPHDFVLANSRLSADTFEVAFDTRGIVKYSGFFRGSAARYKLIPTDDDKP